MHSSKSFNLLFLVFAFTFIIALAQSTPIKDIPSSPANSKEITSTIFNTNERFVAPINISYDDGEISTSVVIVNLKIEDNKLIINDFSLKLGKTSVQVIEAKVIPADISEEQIDDYYDNYDIALITAEISSSVHSIPTDINNLVINRVVISTTIMAVDGVEVVQAKAIEKTLDIIKQIKPNNQSISASYDEFNSYYQIIKYHHHKNTVAPPEAHVGDWHCSKFTKVVLASFLLTFISIVLCMIILRYQPLIKIAFPQLTLMKHFEQVIVITDEEKRTLVKEQQSQ